MKNSIFNERHHYINLTAQKDPFLFIEAAGIVEPDAEYSFDVPAHELYVFDYIQYGCGYVDHDGSSCRVAAGDVTIRRCHESRIGFRADQTDPYRKLWFSGDGQFFDAMCRLYGITETVTVIRMPEAEPYFTRIVSRLYSPGYCEEEIVREVSGLFWMLFRSAGASHSPEKLERIRGYMERNCEKLRGLKEVTTAFGISERQLGRSFRAAYGVTPWAFVMEKRLERAKMLLAGTNAHVVEIAYSCGFTSSEYFITAFRQRMGMTPAEYRAQCVSDNLHIAP
ncbi:MAG: helix-turn-helix transcriptional regulator [Clostridia bacterium]|nr:helix-turn-helix transcriptional regulator [Clostridia bacterium]